ncbi:hypothetical protein B484DRAFT_451996 [Ochromonadaceae sp. CCMP2298]|nr:hypothetical protein B484DRAFT_451996 [Ochromonadaceae sp. CCMP2298]
MRCQLFLVAMALLVLSVASFRTFARNSLVRPRGTISMATGTHGEDFKFLFVTRGSEEDHYPRIIPVAGTYPGITDEELRAPYCTPAAAPGQWAYQFPDPENASFGTVAVPGNIIVTEALDPVAVITTNTALGIKLIEEVEMLVVVDRGDKGFNSADFYLFKDANGNTFIRWLDRPDFDAYDIMGKVMVCMVPFTDAMKRPKSGFLEDDDGI